MLPENPTSYEDLQERFKWQIPHVFNIGFACSDAPAFKTPNKPAILDYSGDKPLKISFGALAERSTKFAAALSALGIKKGDRIAVMLPQCHEAVVAHLGIYKLGAIVVPLAMQFGPQALQHRLHTSSTKAFIGNQLSNARLSQIKNELPELEINISIDHDDGLNFESLIEKASTNFKIANTGPNDPAMMLFTSGTTGQPKGTLHGHRVLLGHLPGIQMAQGFMPKQGDIFWTPSDWAWAGGLLNALLPALYFGVTVVASRAPKFEPYWAMNLINKAKITNVFMPATAIKMMQSELEKTPNLALRSLGTAGEALGAQTLNWAEQALGLHINEFYGQTECNAIISACKDIEVFKQGSMGKQVPGHQVSIVDETGTPLPAGQAGEIAVHKSSPVMFLKYWNAHKATKEKFKGDWMLTGDLGSCDDEGYFHFLGRNDDIITSSGYRIGPSEIEDCLTSHPSVALTAVTGHPDPVRTQIICANIQLSKGISPSVELEAEIRAYVKNKLSAHQYPRIINFVDHVPLTESGKVIRRHFRDN
ncbi:putative acyl--CoA ligase YtcI [Nymphon striatum]|nr:putative acyl--CoA ligase YtcI [Nymphon striatum]